MKKRFIGFTVFLYTKIFKTYTVVFYTTTIEKSNNCFLKLFKFLMYKDRGFTLNYAELIGAFFHLG